jgi:hypothetical protein
MSLLEVLFYEFCVLMIAYILAVELSVRREGP